MTSPSKRRVQIYSALLALVLLLVAFSFAQSAAHAMQSAGLGGAWGSLLAAFVLVLGAIALLVYAVRVAPLRLPPRR